MASHSLSSLGYSFLVPAITHFHFQGKSSLSLAFSLIHKPITKGVTVRSMGSSASSPNQNSSLKGLIFFFNNHLLLNFICNFLNISPTPCFNFNFFRLGVTFCWFSLYNRNPGNAFLKDFYCLFLQSRVIFVEFS